MASHHCVSALVLETASYPILHIIGVTCEQSTNSTQEMNKTQKAFKHFD